MPISDELNLDLAWRRYKRDQSDMAFADHPYQNRLIELHLDKWIADLKSEIDGNYTPSRSEIIDIPKPNFHLRPGYILKPKDATLFQALMHHSIDKIRDRLLWSASKHRYSYILKEDQTTPQWFVNEIGAWNNFRIKSLEYLDEDYEYVVFVDISAFFENISVNRLISELTEVGFPQQVINLLSKCLNRWAEPRSRGIPQGYRPSFILAELYLDSIDKRLYHLKIPFTRYVDDIRLFCKNRPDAIKSLHLITCLMREKELNLQTAKSFILDKESAKQKIDGIAPIVKNMEKELKDELSEIFDFPIDYATPSNITSYVESHELSLRIETLRRAFQKYIEKKTDSFDKTLFHYCINRLGAAQDDTAAEYCLTCAIEHPEEMPFIIKYLGSLEDSFLKWIEQLIDNLEKNSAVTDRHAYLILKEVFDLNIVTDAILQFCRNTFNNRYTLDYTRDYARAILGNHGDSSDLDAIEVEYSKETSDLAKATILCSIRRMISVRRNSVYSRAKGENALTDLAIEWAKSN